MPDYLIHFNKNHDPKSGRFAPGDGNGDGRINDSYGDHGIVKDKKKTRRNAIIGTAAAATVTAGIAAMMIADAVNTSRTRSGKMFANDYRRASVAKFVMAYSINYNIDSSYLIHYNKNHSKANGQFVSGDGDGDGVANDHANQKKNKSDSLRKAEKKMKVGKGLALGSWGLTAASAALGAVGKKETNIASFIAGVADLSMFAVGMSLQASGRKEVARLRREENAAKNT